LNTVLSLLAVGSMLIGQGRTPEPSSRGLDSRPSTDACTVSLTLVPPSPITDQISLDVRMAVHHRRSSAATYDVRISLDDERPSGLLHQAKVTVAPNSAGGVYARIGMRGRAGPHRVIAMATDGTVTIRTSSPLDVVPSSVRSTGRIDGAWTGFYHWSEDEGRLWNAEIQKMTDQQWRELVRAMHDIRMDVIVIQEVFRNQQYRGRHSIEQQGYEGKAFYPSRLYSGRMPIAAGDPVEAILSEADRLGMHVFMGVGLYAWFDFSPASLQWHRNVAGELWTMYGHHPSFYGWYVSEEIAGNLGGTPQTWREIVDFFRAFRAFVRGLAPDKPVMLASNSHQVDKAVEVYPQLLEHLDILCPFGFHRPPPGDLPGERAAVILQKLCDQAGAHLWMDLEVFLFGQGGALYPRPIEGLIDDLRRFPAFEKVLCYQFPGLMNAPSASITPGGPATVKLYRDYGRFIGNR